MAIRQDVTYALRLLRGSPVFTLTAILSLAIGIAANGAIFSLADAILFRGRPGIADPERLVDVGRSQDGEGFDNISYPNYLDYRERNVAFTGFAAFRAEPTPLGLGAADGADRVYGTLVSANYFAVLGVPMAVGRAFLDEEDRIGGANQVAVITHTLWRRRFQADPHVLGRVIRLNGRPFTIVGVASEGFVGHTFLASDLWVPLTAFPALTGRNAGLLTKREAVWLATFGRLKPGVTIDQARDAMTSLATELERQYPEENKGKGVAIAPSHRVPGLLRSMVSAFIGLLFALVGLVLLIACTNVAGMLLARGVARSREVAVRLAVGADRARIVRQLVTESVLLALAGCGAGVLLATWMIQLLHGLQPSVPFPLSIEFRLDWRVIAFSVALALVTGILFGLVPAFQAARTDLATALKPDASHAPRRMRLRHGFVVAQVAMSVLLVVCALLFARSLRQAGSIDPGFVAENVDVAEIDLRFGGYSEQTGLAFAEHLLTRVEQLPGVHSAAFTRVIPLTGSGLGLGRLSLPGQPRDPRAPDRLRPDWNVVTPRFFETMQTQIVEGRGFTAADRRTAPFVAVVNETFARQAWPGESAIGKTLFQQSDPAQPERELHVVGVARDGKYRSLGEAPRAFIYVPLAQQYMGDVALLIRTSGRSALPDLRTLLRQVDPNLPIVHAASLEAATALGLLPQRLAALIAASFGGVGLLLACIGIYGITAFSVTQRIREIGLRMALGATRRTVLQLVVGQAMRLAIVGVGVGLLGAAGATQLLGSLLYGIAPIDPVSFGGGAALFCALGLTASWLPARRAASVNPVEALRTE